MLLSQTTEYALRAMAVLASLGPAECCRSHDLATATGIPVHYLSKIMRQLVVADLVVSKRGHGGGFALQKPAREITFSRILEALGRDPSPEHCAFGWGDCDPENPCPLHDSYSRLVEVTRDWAETNTLEDISERRASSQDQRESSPRGESQ